MPVNQPTPRLRPTQLPLDFQWECCSCFGMSNPRCPETCFPSLLEPLLSNDVLSLAVCQLGFPLQNEVRPMGS